MSKATLVRSGKEYSYLFPLKDGKNFQDGNCVVTNVTPALVTFRDTKSEAVYTKKLADVLFGPVKNRGKH